MKKRLLLLTTILSLILLGACGGGEKQGESSGESNDEAKRISIATTQTEDSHYGAYLNTFKEEVEKNSNGAIEVSLHYNSELGNERDNVESVQMGTLDGAFISSGVISNFVDEFNVLDFPFLFENTEHARSVLNSDIGEEFNASLLEVGIKNLGFGENGFRNITNNERPIVTPKDLEGIKIRTMEVPIHQEVFAEFGASPTPMAWSEVFTSLQQGVIDAQENPIAIIYSSKLNEVQKYVSMSGHVYSPAVFIFNNELFESFSGDLQQVLLDAAKVAQQANYDFIDQNTEAQLEELKQLGMEINEIDLKAFQDAAQPVIDKYKGEYSELYDKIKAAAN
ncbi:DctP family TRAP transporter solute-binding subunit [Lysinibacillus telephonicus]|uniref:DctP family TRAP transporter solute-binding subunit n=1 Tax=Lysinibacillus telephonicus TaxID=1714840 RepID=A0A431USV8_9BACI|nr:DctP family TRAP transporter solute-binding subunit [Lysinibacillus telephonicus]RTQ92654.1 DctP family TRAP transporter solute-binding subunit [Lysinibacillus telephonicus]